MCGCWAQDWFKGRSGAHGESGHVILPSWVPWSSLAHLDLRDCHLLLGGGGLIHTRMRCGSWGVVVGAQGEWALRGLV